MGKDKGRIRGRSPLSTTGSGAAQAAGCCDSTANRKPSSSLHCPISLQTVFVLETAWSLPPASALPSWRAARSSATSSIAPPRDDGGLRSPNSSARRSAEAHRARPGYRSGICSDSLLPASPLVPRASPRVPPHSVQAVRRSATIPRELIPCRERTYGYSPVWPCEIVVYNWGTSTGLAPERPTCSAGWGLGEPDLASCVLQASKVIKARADFQQREGKACDAWLLL